jgi:hypothetical protein
MDIPGIRYYRFKDDETLKTLKEKAELFEKLKVMQEQVNKIEEESKPITNQYMKVRDKGILLIKEHTKDLELGEYEINQTAEFEGDEVVITIVDLLEEEKLRIKELKRKENESIVGGADGGPIPLETSPVDSGDVQGPTG